VLKKEIELYIKKDKDSDSAAISLILNFTFFSFNNKIYKQIFGDPMSSPLSPIIADIQ